MDYDKTKIAIRYRMLGAKMFMASKAMNYAINFHNGKRKDGEPEFSHQVFIANYAYTLPIYDEDKLEIILASIFLHDVCEDYDVTFSDIKEKFGDEIHDIIKLLTKEINGIKIDSKIYFERMRTNPFAIIVKGCDRLHNINSMSGAFSKEKQIGYIKETRDYHLPLLKYGRETYPEYELVFENIKQSINGRIELIEKILVLDNLGIGK